MKTLCQSLLTTAGACTLLAVLSPIEASAQSCRSKSYNHHRSYYSGHHHHNRVHRYSHAPRRHVRVYAAPRRVVTHSHYGGPIYYRNRSAYCARPTVRYRTTYVAPRRYSLGVRFGYSSYGRRCR